MAIRMIITHEKKALDPSWVSRFVSTLQPDHTSPRGTLYVIRADTSIDVVAVDDDQDRLVFCAGTAARAYDIELNKLYYAAIQTELQDDEWHIDAFDLEHGRIVVNKAIISAQSVIEVEGRTFLTFVLEK